MEQEVCFVKIYSGGDLELKNKLGWGRLAYIHKSVDDDRSKARVEVPGAHCAAKPTKNKNLKKKNRAYRMEEVLFPSRCSHGAQNNCS